MKPPPDFLALASAFGIEFEPGDLDQLRRYLDLLLETNEQFNLTSITDRDEAWMKHIFDSLTLMPFVQAAIESRMGLGGRAPLVMDVGSGGGLPGIPLAIVQPAARFTLLEATGKKARFLERVRDELGLNNLEVVNQRAEQAGQDHKRHREQYDLVVSRAVGHLRILLELTVPFARVGGVVAVIKGAKAADEVAAAKQALHLLHSSVVESITTATGTIVAIAKQRKTPRVYPRAPGEPKRRPLGSADRFG